MKKVAIVQRHLADYRVKFYNILGEILIDNNIELKVFGGNASLDEGYKDGLEAIKYAQRVKNYNFGKKFYWQNIYQDLKKYDLIIIEQSNSAILNYQIFFTKLILKKKFKLAFWGHGKVLHKKDSFISKRIREFFINRVDYWFGYTEITKKILNDNNVSDKKITIVNNSIDFSYVSNARKNKVKIDNDYRTLIFCSRLYKNKAINFLIDGCEIVKKSIPKLKLVIIGDGPEKKMLNTLAKNKSWIKVKGALYDREKARNLVMGDLMLLPSHVGLSILDGFAAGLPIVVSDFKNHCPEISYFENNVNGIMTKKNLNDFSEKIIFLLSNSKILQSMKQEAIKTSKKYTVEIMAKNFAQGIINNLKDY